MTPRLSVKSALPALSFAALVGLDARVAAQSPPTEGPAQRAPGAAPAEAAPPDVKAAFEEAVAPFNLEEAVVSSSGLTSNEAAQRAVERSPQIASAEAATESAHWDARAQWSGFLPQLNAYVQYFRVNFVANRLRLAPNPAAAAQLMTDLQNTFGLSPQRAQQLVSDLGSAATPSTAGPNFTQPQNQYALGAGFTYNVSDVLLRVWHAYEAAKSVENARKLQADAMVATVELQTRQAFYAYELALANRAVFEQALKQADAQRAQIQLFVDAGTAAPVDLMTAVSRVEAARAELARTEGAVATARNTLSTYSGIPLENIDKVNEPLALPAAPTQNSEELVKFGIERRPELKAARALIDGYDETRKAERGGAMPVLSLQGSVLDAVPNPRYIPINRTLRHSWIAGAVLSWSPNQSLVGYQRTQRANADQNRARADLYNLEDQVRIEVVQAYEDYKAADAAAKASEAQLKAAEEAYRVRLAMYRVGAGVIIDLLDADLRVTQARLAFANAAIDARVALARLNRAAVLDH